MCEGASKQTPDLKILPPRDRAPRFEIPGSAIGDRWGGKGPEDKRGGIKLYIPLMMRIDIQHIDCYCV